MGKLAMLKYAAVMMLTLQVVLTAFTITALYGGDVNPIGHSARAILVYVLPLLILANAVMVVYWLIRRRWLYSLIPIVTIACCIPYIGTIWQFRSLDKSAEAQSGIKIATYNVCMFNRETSGFMAQDILAEMRRQNVDVLCMQEYNDISGVARMIMSDYFKGINSFDYINSSPELCAARLWKCYKLK
jgi:endonuclease/exonuclease/phosphatase (EEP) superfamily protein YafD